MPNNHLGDPSFRWWWGCVEDRIDPLQKGRVRVRIHSYHSPFKKDIPTEALPWAEVLQPATTGNSPQATAVGLHEGLWVFGFFKDGAECQQPVVLGWLPTLPEQENKNDTKGSDTLQQKDSSSETLQKNYGDGFKDPRTDEELKQYPSNEVERQYPLGKGKTTEKRGAQLKELPPKKQTDRLGRAITINDSTKICDTVIKLKKTARPDGLHETVEIADIKVTEEEYECGVMNISGANKGTLSGLGKGDNKVKSTMLSAEVEKWKLTVEEPLNAADKQIFNEKDCEEKDDCKSSNNT
jgi:hypothetical protein